MLGVTPPTITLLFAADCGLINIWLSVRAGMVRIKGRVMVGDEGNPLMLARMRAHANFNEYVPMALIVMALIELVQGHSNALWILGAMLVLGRLLHPFGMERPAPNPWRLGGILLTWAASVGLIAWAIWIVTHPGAGIRYF